MILLFVNGVSKLLITNADHMHALLNSPLHIYSFLVVCMQSSMLHARNLDIFHGN